jgi:hypothetical protein
LVVAKKEKPKFLKKCFIPKLLKITIEEQKTAVYWGFRIKTKQSKKQTHNRKKNEKPKRAREND